MKYFLLIFSAVVICSCRPQKPVSVEQSEVARIERELSSDAMQGRKPGTPGIERAASFIAEEFRKAGLSKLTGEDDYFQEFRMISAKPANIKAKLNGNVLDASAVHILSHQSRVDIRSIDGFEKVIIPAGANFNSAARGFLSSQSNLIVSVDPSHQTSFNRMRSSAGFQFERSNNIIFLLSPESVNDLEVNADMELKSQVLKNVAAMIKGSSRPEEYVIFSAHYDHLGIMSRPGITDSIYNGANDDASGVTAVIALAQEMTGATKPERSVIFVTFTAEESGGFGSQYFSRQLDPLKVVAMFNIEMIGTESKWGKNSAFITGYDETNMGKIMQNNLQGSVFTFHPDPYPTQNLFYRSDNATLARLGVPAHTISTAKMDEEPHYHKASDEFETLDMENMTAIIMAIYKSASSIINGTDNPTRVKTENLRSR